jgi:hypothetical protein
MLLTMVAFWNPCRMRLLELGMPLAILGDEVASDAANELEEN